MKGDLGIIEIQNRESQAADLTGRRTDEDEWKKKKKRVLKTQHKYYSHFMGEQPTVGWPAGPESQW